MCVYILYWCSWGDGASRRERPAKYCWQPCSTLFCVVSLTILFNKMLKYCTVLNGWSYKGWHRKAGMGNIGFSSFAMLLLRYRPHFWETSCHLHAEFRDLLFGGEAFASTGVSSKQEVLWATWLEVGERVMEPLVRRRNDCLFGSPLPPQIIAVYGFSGWRRQGRL